MLSRAAGGLLASMAESGFENGRIGGTGEAFEAALSLRQRPLSSASWRPRDQRFGLHYRPIGFSKTFDERHNGTCDRLARERCDKDPMIGGMILRPTVHPEFRSLDCEKLDLHKAVTDPPSRWPLKMPFFG